VSAISWPCIPSKSPEFTAPDSAEPRNPVHRNSRKINTATGRRFLSEYLVSHISLQLYLDRAFKTVERANFIPPTLKTSVFGFIIGTVSGICWLHDGRRIRRSAARGYQQRVLSSLLIILADVVLLKAIFFLFPNRQRIRGNRRLHVRIRPLPTAHGRKAVRATTVCFTAQHDVPPQVGDTGAPFAGHKKCCLSGKTGYCARYGRNRLSLSGTARDTARPCDFTRS
jgi:hypothetical protein